jgi:1-acyl-sn-glycerol-3-phosphate acyltransferase
VKQRKPPGWRVYRLLILVFWPLKWWCRLEVRGIERIPRAGAVLVVSNHDSWMDPLALGAAIMTRDRPLRFLAKASLWHTWIQRVLLDGMGQIPIERGIGDMQAMQAAIDALDAGDAVGIFPEGTISRGRAMRARRGVSRLAQGSRSAPVVLAAVSGGTDAIRFPKRPRIVVDLFEPAGGQPRPDETQGDLAARLMAEIRERVPPVAAGRHPQAAEPEPGSAEAPVTAAAEADANDR